MVVSEKNSNFATNYTPTTMAVPLLLNMKNKSTLGLYILSVINLLVMHYYIMTTCRLEEATDAVLWIDNLLGIVIDITIVGTITLLFTWGRLRISLFITAIITLLWSFSNVLYSRFFHHYISISAISQTGTLADGFMLQNVAEGIKWFDFLFLALGIAAIELYYMSRKEKTSIKKRHLLVTWPACLTIADVVYHLIFCLVTPGLASASYYQHRLAVRHWGLLHSSAEPNWASFHRGSLRQLLIPQIYQAFTTTELTEEQRKAIETEYKRHEGRTSDTTKKINDKNIIFIIVESYLSVTSDLIVDGREVTPFLNSLKRDSTVYFNGQLTSNISIGESSDGQFLYMAGMLPLRSEVTVTKAKNAELPGLPKLLKQEQIIKEAHMVIPTLPSMWEQESMCQRYGFDHLYSSADYEEGKYWYLTDRQIFEYALQKNMEAPKPFLSVELTMTMHQPYNEPKDSTFIIRDSSLTEKYRNYLSTCHYTDQQIKWYFGKLKEEGLYDNSIIVIVADHHAHPSLFEMKEEEMSIDIPLYIINGGINNATAWDGRCNQLDVYTTLLDIVGTKNNWHGFGHTLITKDYHNSIKPELWTMSEEIVIGKYFN